MSDFDVMERIGGSLKYVKIYNFAKRFTVDKHCQVSVTLAGATIRGKWGMANDGEWRTPHFQQKWKRGHNENSLWQ